MDKYHGITYQRNIAKNLLGSSEDDEMYQLWSKIHCPKEWHLFDEIVTLESHELHCDACGLTVGIDYIQENS